jgi:hypothetical protein
VQTLGHIKKMYSEVFQKIVKDNTKFNDAGRNEDFAPIFDISVVVVHGKIALVG